MGRPTGARRVGTVILPVRRKGAKFGMTVITRRWRKFSRLGSWRNRIEATGDHIIIISVY